MVDFYRQTDDFRQSARSAECQLKAESDQERRFRRQRTCRCDRRVAMLGFRLEEAAANPSPSNVTTQILKMSRAGSESHRVTLLPCGIQEKPRICGHGISGEINGGRICTGQETDGEKNRSQNHLEARHRKLQPSRAEKELPRPSMKLKTAIRTAAIISPPIRVKSGVHVKDQLW